MVKNISKTLLALALCAFAFVGFAPNANAAGFHTKDALCWNHRTDCSKCGSTSYTPINYVHHNYMSMTFKRTTYTYDYDYAENKCKKCGTIWNGKLYTHITSKTGKRC